MKIVGLLGIAMFAAGSALAADVEVVYTTGPKSIFTYERRKVNVELAIVVRDAYLNNDGDVVWGGRVYKDSETVKTFIPGPVEHIPYKFDCRNPHQYLVKNSRGNWVRKLDPVTWDCIREDGAPFVIDPAKIPAQP